METKNSRKILIIDDSFINNLLFSDILERAGFSVHTLNSGKKALSKTLIYKPSVILLDIMMPGVDGFEVLDQLKSNKETENIPVIMVTADSKYESFVKARNLGAVDYIIKPIGAYELIRKVKKTLNEEVDKKYSTPMPFELELVQKMYANA